MAGIKTILGIFPKTNEYEQNRKLLEVEYNAIQEFESSDELARLRELEKYVNSSQFKEEKSKLFSIQYNGTKEYLIESELRTLEKDKTIRSYYKTLESDLLDLFKKVENSKQLARYKELDEFLKSEEYKTSKDFYRQSGEARFQKSDLGSTLREYTEKKNSEQIKAYKKFIGHKLYDNYKALFGSKKLVRYEELKKKIESSVFAEKRSSLNKNEFLASTEGKEFIEFNGLNKAKDIKEYYKLYKSPLKKHYDKLYNSEELKAFLDLEKFIESSDFKDQKAKIKSKTFKDTAEFSKLKEFQELKKEKDIKVYFKFLHSKELENYNDIKESKKLKRLEELRELVKTKEFIEKKNYYTMKPKVRWIQSDPFAKLKEYEQLKKSEKILWFFKNREHKKFDWLRTWKLSFNEEFENRKLDTKKWLTRYYWGDEMISESYSLSHELHCITDGKNIEFGNDSMRIITRQEKANGTIWDPDFGFQPHEFDYTSGLVSTGKSFRSKYGYFEAKIKFSDNQDVLNAFWLVGNQMLPHIDIAKALKRCSFGIQWDEKSNFKKSYKRKRYSDDFHIFSLEWDENKISWRINGEVIASTNKNVPQEPMYMVFSSGVYKNIEKGTPATMNVEWVRCYEKN